MFCNSNVEKEITHLFLMTKEGVENRDTSGNDDDDVACTSDDDR